MMKYFHLIVLAILVAACSGDTRDTVSLAEQDYNDGRYEAAVRVCDSLILGQSFPSLSVDELCRLSVLMVKLADHSDEENNFALAARCMRAALERNPDSVAEFVQTLPVDEQSQSVLIQQLITAIDHPVDPSDLHQHTDSILNDTIIIE